MAEIHGYRILKEVTATSGKLYFTERRGRRYVLKEFSGYRFPAAEGETCSAALRPVQERAERFYARLKRIMAHLRGSCREDGLLNLPLEVFREGQMIYKVTRLIEDCGLTVEQLHEKLNSQQLSTLLKTLLLQLESLGRAGFVHGDIKPENAVISRRGSVYSGSLIDYDTGFLVGETPDHVDYTPEYAAPEMIWLHEVMGSAPTQEELREAFAPVTCAADVFAMACVFCHMLTGDPWQAEGAAGKKMSPGNQILQGFPLRLPPLHPVWRYFLRAMTAADPAKRMSPRAVINGVNACITSGLFGELEDPWQEYPAAEDMPLACGDDARLTRLRGQRTLMWHVTDCWQLPRPFLWRPDSVQQLRLAQSTALKRLERLEKRVAGLCSKGSILRPFTVVRRGRRVFAAVQLPEGRLYPLCALPSLTTPGEADALMAGLLDEMQRLHDAGLLHGALDMNSVAVLIPADGKPQLVLTDPHRLCSLPELTRGLLPGDVPELLAPEMCLLMTARDAETRSDVLELMGPPADVFSLGLLLHVAFTGVLPRVQQDGCASLAMAAREDALVLDAALEPARVTLLQQLLAYEPDDRLQSCREAAACLRALTAPQPVTETPADDAPVIFGALTPDAFLDDGDVLLTPSAVELPDVFMDTGDELLMIPDADPAALTPDMAGEDALLPDEPECPAPELPTPMAGEAPAPELPAPMAEEVPAPELPAPMEEEFPLIIGDLDEVCHVEDFGELPNGFLRHAVHHEEEDRPVLLQALLPRLSFLEEHGGWFEARRREWNRIAGEEGLLPVRAVCQHGGVPYGVTPCRDEWGQLVEVDYRNVSLQLAKMWITSLLEQLGALHRRGLRCPLISPGELVFLHKRYPLQARLHPFAHFIRAGHPEDAQHWQQMLRERYLREECRSWALDQPMAWLAPEVWDNVFDGARNEITPAADMFSLGVMIHVLLTGRHPVRGGRNWRDAFSRGKVVVDVKLDFPMRCLLMKMLAEDPRKRPTDCAAVLEFLSLITREEDKVRTVTARHNGELLTGRELSLYALADGQEHLVATARVGASGRASFRGHMPRGFTYEVRCGGYRHVCRWQLT